MNGSAPQTVLVAGGGIGGVATANRLRRRLPRRHRVVLINREADFRFEASFLWVMSGARRPAQVTRPLNGLRRRGVEVEIGTVTGLDPSERSVAVDGRTVSGDHLVVSLGAEWASDRVPGLAEHGHTFATLAGASRLARELERFDAGRVLVVTASPLYKCPAAPYEAALLIDAGLRKRGVRSRVQVAVRSAEPAPMPVAGPSVSAAVEQLLVSRGIEYRSGTQITAVEPRSASFGESSEEFDLLVYMPPIRAPHVVASSALAADDGWVHADPSGLTTSFEGVYAIGDNTHIILRNGKPLPRAGVFAHRQAHAVADTIAASISGRPETSSFDGHGGCFVETGGGRAAYGAGNFYAEPAPAVTLKPPSRLWHLGKVGFELLAMRRWL